MRFVVPFDGSPLAEAAFLRAGEFADGMGEDLVALAVVPSSSRYAVKKRWVEEGTNFAPREVIAAPHRQITELVPEGSFQARRADTGAREGADASTIRRTAVELDASVVFLGSENAGQIVVPVSSAAAVSLPTTGTTSTSSATGDRRA